VVIVLKLPLLSPGMPHSTISPPLHTHSWAQLDEVVIELEGEEIRKLQQMDTSCRERMLLAGVRVLVGEATVVLTGMRASRWACVNVWLHIQPATCSPEPQRSCTVELYSSAHLNPHSNHAEIPLSDDCTACLQMQVCNFNSIEDVLPFTPSIIEFRSNSLHGDSQLPDLLCCAPLLSHVEVNTMYCDLFGSAAPQTLQALRSLPQIITWQPLELWLEKPYALSTVHEVCAALAGTPLAQAVSKLTLCDWLNVEPPFAALRVSFPNVLHFELDCCLESMASSLSEAIAAWPMLQSVSLRSSYVPNLEAAHPYLEARHVRRLSSRQGNPLGLCCVSWRWTKEMQEGWTPK